MDVYEAMAARKTIRDFAERPLDDALIQKLIKAGFCAPTNNHMREWHFIVLQDKAQRKELLDQVIHPVGKKGAIGIVNRWGLTDECQRGVYIDAIPKQYSMLYNAGLLMLPCFCQPKPLTKARDITHFNGLASIWACIENILVAAAAEGLFGVTRIPFKEESIILKEVLHIPAEYEIPCWIALGYPAESAKRFPQVEIKVEERIHNGQW